MSKAEKEHVAPVSAPAPEPMPATGCVVCGSYEGTMSPVTPNARVHAECSVARPDVVARVKARA